MNRIMVHSQRLAPRSVVVRAAARVMRPGAGRAPIVRE